MSKLTFTPVASSMMSGYHHDPVSKVLTVQFKGGAPYEYAGVPSEKVDAMLAAPSAGIYFANHIKPRHPATKVR